MEAVGLLESYLTNRSQQVRLGQCTSSWENLFKGVPQGSILGPLLFNVFLNDIFYFVLKCIIYNYANDYTVAYIHKDLNTLKLVLENKSLNLISWIEDNFMKANPDKFQAICAGKKCHDDITSFRIGDTRVFPSRVRNLYHMLKTLVGQCRIYLRAKCMLKIYD